MSKRRRRRRPAPIFCGLGCYVDAGGRREPRLELLCGAGAPNRIRLRYNSGLLNRTTREFGSFEGNLLRLYVKPRLIN
ncbi:UNVERIFIED_CONTAM: hypothetical protein Slati_3373900 [Sesamum latifolium]|uniref:Uncharacterized protein n=1 Tax=Sesamum latifolium TaxID=2727402 RepID=A0AAW2UDK5_9LAMI